MGVESGIKKNPTVFVKIYMVEMPPTLQIHAEKCFWRPGGECAVGLLISALESIPHLLVHLAATPEVYTWGDKWLLID